MVPCRLDWMKSKHGSNCIFMVEPTKKVRLEWSLDRQPTALMTCRDRGTDSRREMAAARTFGGGPCKTGISRGEMDLAYGEDTEIG